MQTIIKDDGVLSISIEKNGFKVSDTGYFVLQWHKRKERFDENLTLKYIWTILETIVG